LMLNIRQLISVPKHREVSLSGIDPHPPLVLVYELGADGSSRLSQDPY